MTVLTALSTASPQRTINQEDELDFASRYVCRDATQQRLLKALYRRSGVRRRASVTLDPETPTRTTFFPPPSRPDDLGPTTRARLERFRTEAPELAAAAARGALAEAGLEGGRLGHLITVSCTGVHAPGLDTALLVRLGQPPDTPRTHLGFMGCHAALNAGRLGDALVRAGAAGPVLVCAVELCSLHFQYGWDPDTVVANALFGDGAAAAVLASEGTGWQVGGALTLLLEGTEAAMTWQVGDNGFLMTLSAEVPALIGERLGPPLDHWLATRGLGAHDIRSWAIHPGGPRVVSEVAAAMGLSPEATATSREVLADHGNMSSPTVLFVLERLRRLGAELPCVALAFGPGLSVEAVLFR